jgi:hypothetical protein
MKRLKRIDMREWLHDRSTDMAIDEELLAHSRAARIGKRLCQASFLVHAFAPLLAIAAIILLTAMPALAQSPGGSIFGGNDQTVGNGVREFVKWGRNLLFLLGIVFVIWGIVNYAIEKSWMKQLIGGVGCFGFSGVAALAYSFSQGQAVQLDTTLN